MYVCMYVCMHVICMYVRIQKGKNMNRGMSACKCKRLTRDLKLRNPKLTTEACECRGLNTQNRGFGIRCSNYSYHIPPNPLLNIQAPILECTEVRLRASQLEAHWHIIVRIPGCSPVLHESMTIVRRVCGSTLRLRGLQANLLTSHLLRAVRFTRFRELGLNDHWSNKVSGCAIL